MISCLLTITSMLPSLQMFSTTSLIDLMKNRNKHSIAFKILIP